MKLIRWSLAGASAYVIYKYAIGKKTQDAAALPDEGEVTQVGDMLRPGPAASSKRPR